MFHCALGDVVIALTMFAVACTVLRLPDWLAARPWTGGAIVTAGATAYTAWSEWFNVYSAGSWSYAPAMPTVFGIGLSPLLQWPILPSVMVIAHGTLSPLLLGNSSGGLEPRKTVTFRGQSSPQ